MTTSSSSSSSSFFSSSKSNIPSSLAQSTIPEIATRSQTAQHLTPQFCFNTSYLRDFLRTSRSQLDDTISTSLNSLLTPSITSPFDPSSTSPSTSASTRGSGSRRSNIPAATCSQFIEKTVFPTWSSRSQILSYCSIVATSEDPDDPDRSLIDAENLAHSHATVNERLDPYSGRFFPKEPRTEVLGSVLRNENAVESIVRERTWQTLNERCEGSRVSGTGPGWREAIQKWEAEQKS